MAPSVIGYVFDALTGRFRGADGRFLSTALVRKQLDSALDGAARDAAAIADSFSSGAIGVTEFENQMRQLIKDTQIYSVAVSAGGFNQMGVSEIDLLTQRIAEQYSYLGAWADQLRSGVQGSERALAARAKMYVYAARNSYDVNYRTGQLIRGYTEEKNILNPGESCSVCISMTNLGRVPIGTLIPIGERTCLGNCNCDIKYYAPRGSGLPAD